MKTRLTLLAVSLLLTACSTPTPGNHTPPNNEGGNLTLAPAGLLFTAGGEVASDTRTLTLTNAGDATLELKDLGLGGANASNFAFVDDAGVSLAPGESRTLEVTYKPAGAFGPQHAELLVASDGAPAARVPLGALNVMGQGANKEPSLQWIFDAAGLKIATADADPATTPLVDTATNALLGDEIAAQTFVKADAAQPVTLQVLAAFGVTDVEPIFTYGYYDASAAEPEVHSLATVASTPGLNGQRLNPVVRDLKGEAVEFDPGMSPFGLYSEWPTTRFYTERTIYSEDARNTFAGALPHHVRVYPLKDAAGKVEENAYVLATNEFHLGNDFNDAVVIVRNVRVAP